MGELTKADPLERFAHDGFCNCDGCMSALHSDGFPNPYAGRRPYRRTPTTAGRSALQEGER